VTEPAASKPRPVKAVKAATPDAPAPAPAPAPAAVPPEKAPQLSARELRAHRSRKIGVRFLIFVGLPTVIACVYYLAIATPEFDARAVVAIQATHPDADVAAAKTDHTKHQRDAYLLADHVRSGVMRTAVGAGALEIDATVDGASSAVTLRVRASSAADAEALVTKVVEQANAWTEAQSQRARQERIAPAERDVANARAHVAKLERIAQTNAEAATDREVAQLQLEATVEGLKRARMEAGHAQVYLVAIDEPRGQPDQAWPRPAWNILTVIACATVLVAVLSLLGAAVREHANF